MAGFYQLLKQNRNYRYTWMGQVVSEIGDHFNTIAVFALVMETTGSGLVVSGVMLARAIPAVLAGPLAGVLLDRMDRKKIMIASDLFRGLIALLFILTAKNHASWLLYVLSALLMFASPFFTSGRAAILPTIANPEELHTANSVTQITQWTNIAIGAMLGGTAASRLGHEWAFLFNSLSFFFSAFCIWQLKAPGKEFRAERQDLSEDRVVRPWHEYREGLAYMKSAPLILAIGMVGVGWATGGGAAQILFSLFGEQVFHRGAEGIGIIWGCAGLGLVAGGPIGHWLGKRLSFTGYKWTISICYIIHGGAYVVFSLMENFGWALFFIGLSRAAVAVSSVMNFMQLLRHVSDTYRGRVFSTVESLTWGVMMFSMAAAGFASITMSPRVIGVWAGVLSSMTAIYWTWANITGRLPEPAEDGIDPDDMEVHGDPKV